MWPYFCVRVTIRAAEFWTDCSFWRRNLGRPYKRELEKSSLEVTMAWIRTSTEFLVKYLRILEIFLRRKNDDLHTCLTCSSKVRVSSKMIPRLEVEVEKRD